MRRLHLSLLAFASGLLLLAGTGTAAAAQSTIRCESQNGQYRSCSANTSGGVTLARQLSSQGCWQGDTWGYDRNRIWVTRGCRAEFRIGSTSSHSDNTGKVVGALVIGAIAAAAIANHNRDDDYNDGREIRCESNNGRYTRCGYVDRRQHVEIRRQLSNQQCIYGRNWGVDGRQLWVDDGCRAVFVVY